MEHISIPNSAVTADWPVLHTEGVIDKLSGLLNRMQVALQTREHFGKISMALSEILQQAIQANTVEHFNKEFAFQFTLSAPILSPSDVDLLGAGRLCYKLDRALDVQYVFVKFAIYDRFFN